MELTPVYIWQKAENISSALKSTQTINRSLLLKKKEPSALAEGFLIFVYGSRRAAFALLQDDTQTTRA
jgi:hypothetical protein